MTLDAFCASLGCKAPAATRIGRRYYLIPPPAAAVMDAINESPYAAGLFLGEERGLFVPTPALLLLLEPPQARITVLDARGSWLFICGRRVKRQHVVKKAAQDPCLVRNEADETLGLGRFERGLLVPTVDLGTYLRDQ